MANRRPWDSLSPRTRKRYIARGKSLGQTEAQVRQHHESGGNMAVYRGHAPKMGANESQWRRMRQAAKTSKLAGDLEDETVTDILESLLGKGFSPQWIIDRLVEKTESRDTYQSAIARSLRKQGIDAGWQPGRNRYHSRNLTADIEIYFYH